MSKFFRRTVSRPTAKEGSMVKESQDSHVSGGRPITLLVVGCGARGKSYAEYALLSPDKCKIVSIAEPRPKTQKYFAEAHNIDLSLVFPSWEEAAAASAKAILSTGVKLADAVLVTVQDHMHLAVTLAFAKQGYHILCEKPMATSIEDCLKMEKVINDTGVIFAIGHVLRYSPYMKAISAIVQSKELGDLINVVHVEPVGHYHFAHSFVRGNWRSERDSSFALMTKCCHDIDLLCKWFSPATPTRLSSFGSLQHFRKSAKPTTAGEAVSCLECPIESDCPYSAKRIYLYPVSDGHKNWPVSTIVDGTPDIENVRAALQSGPYGKCVYESENDVCDHQVVNFEFSNGSTASFTMVAYTSAICDRQTRLHFTHGEIIGDMSKFTVANFRTRTTKTHHPLHEGGHGGGDMGLIRTFVEAVKAGQKELLGTSIEEVLRSHLTVFAAECSRKEGRIIDYSIFEREARAAVLESVTH